jgi:hypothetical protein
MFALRALAPDRYNERRQIEVKGDVTHRHFGLMITPQDLLALNGAERGSLERILEKTAGHRGEPDGGAPALAAPVAAAKGARR